MATYRTVSLTFWTDPKVDDDFTPEDKYFYLYLLTNPHTNLCGCYEISMKQMVRETGYNEDTVKRLIQRMENVHNVIQYDPETKEILIPKWGKYNWGNSPKVKEGALKVAHNIKSAAFKESVLDTLSIEYPYTMDISVTVTDTNTTTHIDDSKDVIVEDYFDTFWREYPRKTGKGAARKSFEKALTKTSFQKIMAALDEQKASSQWNKDGGEYVPYPATWLNQERWEDEVSQYDGNTNIRNLYAMFKEDQ